MSGKILWNSKNTDLPELDFGLLECWIEAVARSHGKIVGPLGYLFCDDEHILSVNREFLSHDYFTDIITFDYSRGRMISGDMVISLDTVASNAEMVGAEAGLGILRHEVYSQIKI